VLRILGGLIFLVGAAATAVTVHGSFTKPRPAAALLGIVAPLAVLVALTGALLLFIPDFFGN